MLKRSKARSCYKLRSLQNLSKTGEIEKKHMIFDHNVHITQQFQNEIYYLVGGFNPFEKY